MSSSEKPLKLTMPFDRELLKTLKAGDACLLSGPMYTLRDAGHMRLLDEIGSRDNAAGADAVDGAVESPVAMDAAIEGEVPVEGAVAGEIVAEAPELPYGLGGQAIFYAGPTPPAAGRPFGAIGPTTSSRMDFAAPYLYDAGIAATIGKGVRSPEVHEACIRNGAVYFVTVGGAAAYLAKCVTRGETLAYHDLGTEALRLVEVVDLPVFVGIDTEGNDIYELA